MKPKKGEWSLMGGFIQADEDLDQAPVRILQSLTGLGNLFLEQIGAFGKLDRDPGGRVISVAYYALINKDDHEKDLLDTYNAQWFPIDNYPVLVFDHRQMVEAAYQQLVIQSKLRPIGFNLLPPKFTLPELQSLYQAIFKQKLDDRNFRRRVLALGIVRKLSEKQRKGSKKGAFLFEFDQEAYQKLLLQSSTKPSLYQLF